MSEPLLLSKRSTPKRRGIPSESTSGSKKGFGCGCGTIVLILCLGLLILAGIWAYNHYSGKATQATASIFKNVPVPFRNAHFETLYSDQDEIWFEPKGRPVIPYGYPENIPAVETCYDHQMQEIPGNGDGVWWIKYRLQPGVNPGPEGKRIYLLYN